MQAMSVFIAEFEAQCRAAGVSPPMALKAGGVHPTLWSRWKSGAVSPTLRNFEAAMDGLAKIMAAPPNQDAA
jgi:hypothetical protein